MFKDELKALRISKGYTQEDLAVKLGIAKSTVSMYENGKREPDLEMLENIADFFNVDMNRLTSKYQSNKITITELNLIKKYRSLDENGKQFVDLTLEREYQRCNHVKVEKLIARGHESDKPIEVEIKSNIKPKPTDEEF